MSKKRGKKFNAREVAPTKDGVPAQGNQWQASEQQLKWFELYLNPRNKETYGNAYQAGITAGYSESYSRVIATSVGPEWVKSGLYMLRKMNPEHLVDQLQEIALNKDERASDRIQAIKLLGMEKGMFVQKQINVHTGIEQAIQDLE